MNKLKKVDKNLRFHNFKLRVQKERKLLGAELKNPNIKNIGLISFIGATTLACNASQDDQCYGGFGVIVGSLCANQSNPVINTEVKLTQINSSADFNLTSTFDSDGNKRSDKVEFNHKADVRGTKYTLTDGDIVAGSGTVFLNLINSGSIDGQKIFAADEIELSTQGTSVILTSDWYNNAIITIKNSDQSVTLNDLQASKLDSALAEDNVFYPNTRYRVEDINAPNQTISLYFNEEAILGTSTELNLLIKDSVIGLKAGVFIDPNATADAVVIGAEVDPFLVAVDTNIEKLNLEIADTEASGSRIEDLVFDGLTVLNISGGFNNFKFEISEPLEPSLTLVNAATIPADLVLDVSDSLSQKTVMLGSGDDILTVGNSLVASPLFDTMNGGDGRDKLSITFSGVEAASPNLSSFEFLDVSFNSESTLDFSNISDLETLNILESSSGISLTNVPFDLSKLYVSGSQTGEWSIFYGDNSASTASINWSNNTGSPVVVNTLAFEEVQSLSLTAGGANDISLAALSLDPDDTKLTSFTNTDDGNLIVSVGGQLDTFDAVTGISLTATEGGNISLGSAASNFGVSDAQKLSSITLVASQTGSTELGSVGSSTAVEDLQSISITSSGADVTLGSVVASNNGIFSAVISSSATVSIGELNLENPGTSFTATGSGTLGQIVFLNEAYLSINLSDLVTDASVSFVNADTGVTVISGSGNDTITFGLGADVVTGNSGSDIFVINNGSTGIQLGTADIIKDFKSDSDKLKLGFLGDSTVDSGNYVESLASVADYSAALVAGNSALNKLNDTSTALELYAFEYDSNSGYLLIDDNSDGVADGVVILSGVESSTISAENIIV